MKTIKLLFFALAFALVSCSGNDDEPNTPHPKYKIIITGDAYNDQCQQSGSPILNNQYSIKAEFFSNSNTVNSNSWTGQNEITITDDEDVEGEVIGVKIKLDNYIQSNNEIGRGTGITITNIKIINNETDEVLVNEDDPFYLIICTDVIYQGTLSYNTETSVTDISVLAD